MEQVDLKSVLSQLIGQPEATALMLPEHELLVTILATGISEAIGYNIADSRATKKRLRTIQLQAQSWINSDLIFMDATGGVSFGFICESLAVDPVRIRSALNDGKVTSSFIAHYRNRTRKVLRDKNATEDIH